MSSQSNTQPCQWHCEFDLKSKALLSLMGGVDNTASFDLWCLLTTLPGLAKRCHDTDKYGLTQAVSITPAEPSRDPNYLILNLFDTELIVCLTYHMPNLYYA
jgi:hypothetical protein